MRDEAEDGNGNEDENENEKKMKLNIAEKEKGESPIHAPGAARSDARAIVRPTSPPTTPC
jgi:hypothetical protein